MKCAYLNLAVPNLVLNEPGKVPKYKLHSKLEVNLWDRWEVKLGTNRNQITILKLFEYLHKTYELKPSDIFLGSKCLFTSALFEKKDNKEKEKELSKLLVDLVDVDVNIFSIFFFFKIKKKFFT